MARHVTTLALLVAIFSTTNQALAQCSGGGRGGGMGAGMATGFAGGGAANIAGNGLGTNGFTAGGNPQVFAMMLQMQRQNQLLQQQLVAMRQQMMQLQRQNQQLLAQLQSADGSNMLMASQEKPNARGADPVPAGAKLASVRKSRGRPAQ